MLSLRVANYITLTILPNHHHKSTKTRVFSITRVYQNITNHSYKVTIMGANVESTGTTKYCIRGKIEIDGIVETPDVVGALFGQTEGLHFISKM